VRSPGVLKFPLMQSTRKERRRSLGGLVGYFLNLGRKGSRIGKRELQGGGEGFTEGKESSSHNKLV